MEKTWVQQVEEDYMEWMTKSMEKLNSIIQKQRTMTPLPNDLDLQTAMAKAMLDDRAPGVKSISGETIAYSRKVLENLFNQGLSIGFTPKTTQDHMRKADAEYSTKTLMNFKNHGI